MSSPLPAARFHDVDEHDVGQFLARDAQRHISADVARTDYGDFLLIRETVLFRGV